MIYVWLPHSRLMHSYKTYQEYWESYDYESFIKGGHFGIGMAEENTPLWKN